MPSSGARSGTRPSRNDRGAGVGDLPRTVLLACGHETFASPVITGTVTKYACPDGCGLVKKSTRKAK